MKTFLQTCGVTFGCMLPLAAQNPETTTQEVTRSADGSVTQTETTTTISLTPEARVGVVKFFEAFKNEPFGLPPAWVNQFRVNEIPVTWRVSAITRGLVVPERERRHLVEAPPNLISVLPPPPAGIRYFMAGSNVIAADRNYKVVEAVQIPSIRFTDLDVPVPVVEERKSIPTEGVVREVVPVERVERVEREVQIDPARKEADGDDADDADD